MAEIDTALMLRMEASLAKFEKQMSRAKKSGTDTATELERRFASSNKKMARSAEASAMTIGREMDRLRSKYDPLFAASKRYEAELAELNRAHKLGAVSMVQYEAALDRINADFTRASSGAVKMGAATRGLTTITRGGGGGIQNIAFQVGDFATQVGAGTAASVALGQQLPQLLGGFGALGAVLGAVVAIGVPMAAMFFRSGEEAKDLKDRTEELERSVQEYRNAVRSASLPTADLTEKYGKATFAAQQFLATLRDISQATALENLAETISAIATQFGTFESQALGGLQAVQGVTNLSEAIKVLQGDLGLTFTQAKEVASSLERLGEAQGPKEIAEAARVVERALIHALGPVDQMDAGARALAESVAEAGKQALEVQAGMDAAAGSIDGAASSAGRLADELGRAVDNAINLAAQGIQDVKRANIELQYKDDPIGRAGAIAAAQVDAQTPDAPVGTPAYEAWARNRSSYIQSAEEGERLRQELITYRRDQAKTSRGGGRSGRETPGLFERSDDELLQLERQMEMIGKTRAEVARMTAEYKLLDEARKRGLDLDSRQTTSGETLRQEIERQAETIGKLTEAKERATEKSQAMAQMQDQLKDDFIDAIVEGENFAGVMETVAKSIAKAALQGALFGEGPFGDFFGSGLFGGGGSGSKGGLFGGAIIPGILHDGGVAGTDGYGHSRAFAPSTFAGAQRYHNGGIAGMPGLRPNEVPAILERGERVIPNGQGGSVSSAQKVEIVLHAPEGFTAEQMSQVQGVAVRVTSQGISAYDRTTLPGSVKRINSDPRRRG